MSTTIKIITKYGNIQNVPVIDWSAFEPYWEQVVHAMIEVITENKFRPYPATVKRPDGIVASSRYWRYYSGKKFIFNEAKKFVDLLIMNEQFRSAVKDFNAKSNVNWLNRKSLPLLGGRLYGFYYTLKPIFTEFNDGDGVWLKVNFTA